MKILIAEDDDVSCRILQVSLATWGHEVVTTRNGLAAWSHLRRDDAPSLAILDWMMPHMDGLEVCRRVRQKQTTTPTYIILLTAKQNKADVVEGLISGANDYVIKPFDKGELRARVQVGATVVELQQSLATQVSELEGALAHVKTLEGILPICSYCRNIRDDQNYWQTVEGYISEHSEARFSHGICPRCYDTVVKPQLKNLNNGRESS